MTREELIQTYSAYSDQELTESLHTLDDYTPEAKAVLLSIIEERGGIDSLLEKEERKQAIELETLRIEQQVRKMATPGVELEFLIKMIPSELLDDAQRTAAIRHTFEIIQDEKEDKAIKPRTLVGGSLAAGLASVIGGILWGLQLMWSGRIFYIFLIGLVLLCYSMIRLFTKQSHKNNAVVVLTLISVIVALAIGQLMYEVWGRQ
jgi:hypothetical protein